MWVVKGWATEKKMMAVKGESVVDSRSFNGDVEMIFGQWPPSISWAMATRAWPGLIARPALRDALAS